MRLSQLDPFGDLFPQFIAHSATHYGATYRTRRAVIGGFIADHAARSGAA
jgi:hypothetical protein